MDRILKGSIDSFIENTRHKHRGSQTVGEYHPSHIPYCMRRVWYDFKIGREFPIEVKRKMEAGKVIHSWMDGVFKSDGKITVLETEITKERGIGGLKFKGTCDFIVEADGQKAIIDIKSTSWLKSQIEKGQDLKDHHITQVMVYSWMFDIPTAYLLYIDRSDLTTSCHKVEFDKNEFEGILRRTTTLDAHLTENTLPEAEGKLDKDRNWECKNCPYSVECENNKMEVKE